MKPASLVLPSIALLLACGSLAAPAQDASTPPPCSTEKINHTDCVFALDRRYPVTFPTLQMDHGRKIKVKVNNPLPFETLTLDETGAQLLPGTDQGAALAPQIFPALAGLTFSDVTIPGSVPPRAPDEAEAEAKGPIAINLNKLQTMITDATTQVSSLDNLRYQVTTIYAQLSQVLSPLPRPQAPLPPPEHPATCIADHPNIHLPPGVVKGTPNPWECYPDWRNWMKCEIAGVCLSDASAVPGDIGAPIPPAPPVPPFQNTLGTVARGLNRLPGGGAATTNPYFDQAAFDALATTTAQLIAIDQTEPEHDAYAGRLKAVLAEENGLVLHLAVLANALTSVQKDLMTYYQNIELADGAILPGTPPDSVPPAELGVIFDPRSASPGTPYPKFLGRQVVFSVNAVNQIATGRASVTTSSAKVSLATVTVIYANPIFEASAGLIFSFVHNRAFSNETLSTGSVIVQESKPTPELVPYVAANWRLGHDFAWGGNRREAFYATIYAGLNPDTKLPEYGGGPSFSWRSIILSAFYERAHDTRLAGETVGQPLCSPPAGASACASAPSAPATTTFPTNAFGIAIGVRIPTTFTAGTGGISR